MTRDLRNNSSSNTIFLALLVSLSASLLPSIVFAQDQNVEEVQVVVTEEPLKQEYVEKERRHFENGRDYEFYVGAEQTIGLITRDLVLKVQPFAGVRVYVPTILETDYEDTILSLEISAPMNILLTDAEPKEGEVGIRRSDWDSISDFLAIISKATYGSWGEPFYLSLGRIDGYTLGHGTIVNNYTNSIHQGRKEWGFQLSARAKGVDLDVMVDDFADPDLAGGRVAIHPFAFFSDNPRLDSISAGFTFLDHVSAPRQLKVVNNDFVFDHEFIPEVTKREHAFLWGFDFEAESLHEENFLLRHYLDVNFVETSVGAHVGTEFWVRPYDWLGFSIKGELIGASAGYIPYYAGTTFELDQYIFPGWLEPKIEAIPLREVAAKIDYSGMGGAIGGSIAFSEYVSLGILYQGQTGPKNDRLTLELRLRPIEQISAALLYYNGNGDIGTDLINPARAYITAEANATIWGPIYAVGRYTRRPYYHHNLERDSINDFDVGLGLFFQL